MQTGICFCVHNTLATWCKELTHLKRPWCWERLKAGGEGDDRGWDSVASLTQWTWVWVSSGSWWRTGRPGVLQFMGLQRVRHNWETELNWTDKNTYIHTHTCVCRINQHFHSLTNLKLITYRIIFPKDSLPSQIH